jgi:DNA-binding transcriptional ArsR family regulator
VHAFDVLADPVRRRLLELLAEGERSSGDMTNIIQTEFGVTQSAVSQHLKVLRDNGFANVRIDGSRRIYAVNAEPMHDVDVWLDRFRAFWAPKLEALATEIARGKRQRRLASSHKTKESDSAKAADATTGKAAGARRAR